MGLGGGCWEISGKSPGGPIIKTGIVNCEEVIDTKTELLDEICLYACLCRKFLFECLAFPSQSVFQLGFHY